VGLVGEVYFWPPDPEAGTDGIYVTAVAELTDSVIASVVWRAIDAGLLTAVSVHLDPCYEADGYIVNGTFKAARLCVPEHACLPHARVVTWWADPLPADEPWQRPLPCTAPLLRGPLMLAPDDEPPARAWQCPSCRLESAAIVGIPSRCPRCNVPVPA
jgi:hypothetical protein